MTASSMISPSHQGWLRAPGPDVVHRPLIPALTVMLAFLWLFVAWSKVRGELAGLYFIKQDLPVLCLMIVATTVFPYLQLGRGWQTEPRVGRFVLLAAAALLFVLCFAGHWLVMQSHDLSRDEAMATLAMEQLRRGDLVTRVPAEWQPYGNAMLPIFYNGRIDPNVAWTSAYLPINSAFHALAGAIASPALANPMLFVVGLCALWRLARVIWPERRDVAVVVALLGASSTQLIVNAMTSYAMVGHFALNMLWLLLFLRGGVLGVAGAILVGFLTTGLHQLHFHLLFAAPFLLWLACRRQWRVAAIYGVAYLGILLFWFKFYPAVLADIAGPGAALPRPERDLWSYILGRLNRLFKYSVGMWVINLARFVAWQNLLLLPLAATALPLLRSRSTWPRGPFLPLVGACAIGLILMVNQGHGWGYRYLSGLIGCFCLLAGYGWVRLVPEAGAARAWATVRGAFLLTFVVLLPLQLVMAHHFVAPYAEVRREIRAAPAEVVLIDFADGYYAQDLVQNAPDFTRLPLVMELSLISPKALAELCRTRKVVRVDHRHYRAAGMLEGSVWPQQERALTARRDLLDRLGCAAPLALAEK